VSFPPCLVIRAQSPSIRSGHQKRRGRPYSSTVHNDQEGNDPTLAVARHKCRAGRRLLYRTRATLWIKQEGKQRGKKVEQTQFPLAVQTVRGNIGPTRVPEGYRSAWEDDRLNPSSGLQTVAGLRASDQIWSRKVPREMEFNNGKTDMGTVDRQLVYPFTDIKQQRTFLDAKGNYVLEPRDGEAIALVPREKTQRMTAWPLQVQQSEMAANLCK